uniref:Cytochrome p450 18065 n=1 Tax=Calotropis gigantea TaxID=4066 RepID=A0A977JB48_CALGI|nr:cytochrome p450 18065 [Calotropis gigantea]
MHLKLGEVSTIIVSSPDVAKSVMNDNDVVFCSRPNSLLSAKILNYNCLDIAFAPYGDYWRQLRKICTVELLSSKRVQTFRSLREKEVMNMIKLVSEKKGSVLNLSKIIYPLSYSVTALAAFNKRSKYQEQFVSVMDEAIKLMGGFNLCDMYPSFKLLEVISGMKRKLEKTHEIIDGIMENIIKEHKLMINRTDDDDDEEEEMTEDLVDVLLKIQENGDLGVLSDDSIKAVIYDIFSAGGETSSTTIEWTMSELMKNPTILKRAQEEVRKVFNGKGNVNESGLHQLKYLKAVIKESMRLHPAAPLLLPRECTEHCKINGYDVPAKSRVLVNAWAIGRDPTHWIDPEKFYPERFLIGELTDFRGKDFGFIPFGAGRRMCPGIYFAVPILELTIAQLLYHFDWELPGGLGLEELDMSESFGLTVRRKFDLCLIPTPYEHSSIK